MSALIEIDDRGLATLNIPEPDGGLYPYRFRVLPPGLALWAIEVVRADTGATYRVAVYPPSRWDCTCPLQQKGRRSQKPCKHIVAARAVRAFSTSPNLEIPDERPVPASRAG